MRESIPHRSRFCFDGFEDAALLSFGWKVINRKVHINLVGRETAHKKPPCEWCGHRLATRHILNGECGHIREVQGHYYEAVLRAPHLKQAICNELVHVCDFLPDVIFDGLLDVQKEIRDLREQVRDCNHGIVAEE